jgi:enterochelin esterase-like enzyme
MNMQRLRYYLFCFLYVAVGGLAHAGEVVTESFHSDAIGSDYKYTVYLPDNYRQDAKRYPVLYLLHGAGGDENDWLSKGGARETMDALIARRLIQPMIVVMPGHASAWWVDGAKEKGETALIKEVIPHAEGKYRVDSVRGNRLVAGLSAGGYGSLNLVFKYPRMFAAAAILSPAIYDPVPPGHSSAMSQPQFQKDGKFDPERWKSLNYVSHIEAYKKSGIIVPLYIHSGDHDTFGIALQVAMLYEKLRLHQPDAVALRVVNGDHEWMVWRDALGDALQFMNARIAGPR